MGLCWEIPKQQGGGLKGELALNHCITARDPRLTFLAQGLWKLIYLLSREGKQSGEIPVLKAECNKVFRLTSTRLGLVTCA